MKTLIREVDITTNGVKLKDIELKDIKINNECIMSIDGGTKDTGVAIMRKGDGLLKYSIAFSRDKDETPVEYKVRLKRAVHDIISRNKGINSIFYEEPYLGHPTAIANLFMLRVFVEEIIVENEPAFNYIEYMEINNMRWKKLFLEPDKCPPGTELQKKAVKDKLVSRLPFTEVLSQDEMDAIAMGFTIIGKLKIGDEDGLRSKKKVRPFGYNVRFIGAYNDDNMLQEFMDIYNGPESVAQNGIVLADIGRCYSFDKKVYEQMENDDKVLILRYPSDKHANITLQYRVGHLAAVYPFIYAIVWRKNRKRS